MIVARVVILNTSKIFVIKFIDFKKILNKCIKILLIIMNLCTKKTSKCLLLKAVSAILILACVSK